MPQLRARGAFQSRLFKSNLDSFIAVTGSSLNLRYNAWSSFDHCDRDSCAICPKYLGHADFSAQQSTEHILSSLPYCKGFGVSRSYTFTLTVQEPIPCPFCDTPLQLDFDVHACGQIQSCQGLHCFVGRLNNIYQAFMCANLKLLARIFVNKR